MEGAPPTAPLVGKDQMAAPVLALMALTLLAALPTYTVLPSQLSDGCTYVPFELVADAPTDGATQTIWHVLLTA